MMRRSLCIYHVIVKGGLNDPRVTAIRSIHEGVVRNTTISIPEQYRSLESKSQSKEVGTRVSGIPHEDDDFISGLRQSAGAGM
jgi:hypothetical protein